MMQQIQDAQEEVGQLVVEALNRLEDDGGSDEVLELFHERIPPSDAAWWLLAARLMVNRTIGVVEAWLDTRLSMSACVTSCD